MQHVQTLDAKHFKIYKVQQKVQQKVNNIYIALF